MITRSQSVQQFAAKMDELIGGSYILADKKITTVLKTVTASKLFYELISFCVEGYDYAAARAHLVEGQGFPTSSQKDLIAFGFSLMFAIETKEEDLLKLLSVYYPDDNFDRSFKRFAEQFLSVFKKNVVSVAEAMIIGVTVESKPAAITVVRTEETKDLPMTSFSHELDKVEPSKKYLTCYKDIQKILISEKARIAHCRFLKEEEKEDLSVLLNKFKDDLSKGDKEQVKAAFISYKYAAISFKKLESEIEDVERILKFCGAI